MRLGTWTGAALVLAIGCGGEVGVDGGVDAARQDGGTGVDTGPPGDAGMRDGGPPPVDGGGGCGSLTLPGLRVEEVAPGHDWSAAFPVGIEQPPGSTDLFVVDQRGFIHIVRGTAVLGTPFLDVSRTVDFGGRIGSERGLLGLAFHPDYAANGRFFLYYTTAGAAGNVVGEWQRSAADPDRADPAEVARLISADDPEPNHNGGQIEFGPDGFLYAGMGDGGGAGDRHGAFGNGLDTMSPFGKIHRLDVDNAAGGYAAAGNPFSGGGGLPQIWAYGLRNPWRFSFDRATGDLYIADVGQNAWEEIDVQPASSAGGENYGWRAYEGLEVFSRGDLGRAMNHTPPVHVFQHGLPGGPIRDACSVTGGFVYRGSAIPGLQGWYLFGDFCSPDFNAFRYCEGSVMGLQRVDDLNLSGTSMSLITSFGEDQAGELYLIGFSYVLRIVPM